MMIYLSSADNLAGNIMSDCNVSAVVDVTVLDLTSCISIISKLNVLLSR